MISKAYLDAAVIIRAGIPYGDDVSMPYASLTKWHSRWHVFLQITPSERKQWEESRTPEQRSRLRSHAGYSLSVTCLASAWASSFCTAVSPTMSSSRSIERSSGGGVSLDCLWLQTHSTNVPRRSRRYHRRSAAHRPGNSANSVWGSRDRRNTHQWWRDELPNYGLRRGFQFSWVTSPTSSPLLKLNVRIQRKPSLRARLPSQKKVRLRWSSRTVSLNVVYIK